MQKCLIVAVADNYGIGVKGGLPWHISEDLKYFKAQTAGYPVIMGRTTYFSLPFRPLKGRLNIVLNLGGDPIEEVLCVNSFDEAYRAAEQSGAQKCFVMGGASDGIFPLHKHRWSEFFQFRAPFLIPWSQRHM